MKVRIVGSGLGLDLVEAKCMDARMHVRYAPSVVVLCSARSAFWMAGETAEVQPGVWVVRGGGQALIKLSVDEEAGK